MVLVPPSHREWSRAVQRGFRPNGSTWSPDKIYTVRVGITNSSYTYAKLPAGLHDYRYSVAGPWTRWEADLEFYRGLKRCVQKLNQPWKSLALSRCLVYFLSVRALGSFFFHKSDR